VSGSAFDLIWLKIFARASRGVYPKGMSLFYSDLMIKRVCILSVWLLAFGVGASDPYPTVHVKELPDFLKRIWNFNKPDMNEQSRCAAAFDGYGDPDKATLQCSVHIRMAAEGARRAIRYCDDKRAELKIKDVCKIVVE
jgi:hypothetical protein